jgi:hypothetical protein
MNLLKFELQRMLNAPSNKIFFFNFCFVNNTQTPYFPTLIRMLSYSEMTNAIIKILAHFKWGIFGFFFYNYDDKLKGHSPCNHIVAPINHHYNNRSNVHETFEEPSYNQLKEKLEKLKQKSRSKFHFNKSYVWFGHSQCLYLEKNLTIIDCKVDPPTSL